MGWAAMVLAILAGGALGVRTISSFDIGYHLAYGDAFFRTGRLVDSSPELYTLPGRSLRGLELPPGAWIDADGRFRFPNANWLSQIVFSLVHRAGAMPGLSVLQAVVVLSILLILAGTMLRAGLSAGVAGAGVLLISLTAQERFVLRPELLGYLILAGELALLTPLWWESRSLTWRRLAVLVVLQCLLVNLHSYWMLGLALTLAVLAGRVVDATSGKPALPALRRVGVLLGLQAAVTFLNPWTWRIAALPIQTLVFFQRHRISGGDIHAGRHPWSVIGEFFRPLSPAFGEAYATWAFLAVLALTAGGILSAILRRRWTMVFLLVGVMGVSLTMRRNIAPGAMLLVPVALAGLAKALPGRLSRLGMNFLASTAVGLSAAGLLGFVVTNRFYVAQRRVDRFGLGVSRINAPVEAAAWVSEHRPAGRLWCDYDASSNLYYFTQPNPPVPILTNTWAYPPAVLQEVQEVTRGARPFPETIRRYGVEAVALRICRFTAEARNSVPLALRLSASPDWSLVHLGAIHAVFVRNRGPNAALARRSAITPGNFDVAGYVDRLARMDPESAYAIYQGGKTLSFLGWNGPAILVLTEAIRRDPSDVYAWYEMGICHARLSAQYRSPGHYIEAETCFRQCLERKPDFTPAREQLLHLREWLLPRLRETPHENNPLLPGRPEE